MSLTKKAAGTINQHPLQILGGSAAATERSSGSVENDVNGINEAANKTAA